MVEIVVEVVNPLGLHARAAAKLLNTANKYKSKIVISTLDGRTFVNAKSILSVLTLNASFGTKLRVSAEGKDEEMALESVAGLFVCGFDEF